MLKRKIYDELVKWKSREHKCLLVKGQRQVGKTFIIDRFGKENYENYVYLNFAEDKGAKDMFDGDLDADTIITTLSAIFGSDRIVPGKTLIFFDEIQECPRARTSMKPLTIDGRFDVIASGSLLGIKIPNGEQESSVPVGYEEHMTLLPMDFEEFLWAMGYGDETVSMIKRNIRKRTPLNTAVLEKCSEMYRIFMIVGGMPEAVQTYVYTKDFQKVSRVHENIINSCYKDMTRYNTAIEGAKTVKCFESIPSQLSETNKRFMYSRIENHGSRASTDKFMYALMWIECAGYGNLCHSLTNPVLPLKANENRDVFRIYLSDTGLLIHLCGLPVMRSVFKGDYEVNKGGIAENAIMNSLVGNGLEPRYFKKNGENMMELDFLAELGTELVVIEVKSGKKRTSPSMDKYKTVYGEARLIVFENGNIGNEGGKEHYPFFASAFIGEMKKPVDIPGFE